MINSVGGVEIERATEFVIHLLPKPITTKQTGSSAMAVILSALEGPMVTPCGGMEKALM